MEHKSEMLLRLKSMKRELAAKSKKLEKSKCEARIKAFVRQKIKEQNELENMTVGSCCTCQTIVDVKYARDRGTSSAIRKTQTDVTLPQPGSIISSQKKDILSSVLESTTKPDIANCKSCRFQFQEGSRSVCKKGESLFPNNEHNDNNDMLENVCGEILDGEHETFHNKNMNLKVRHNVGTGGRSTLQDKRIQPSVVSGTGSTSTVNSTTKISRRKNLSLIDRDGSQQPREIKTMNPSVTSHSSNNLEIRGDNSIFENRNSPPHDLDSVAVGSETVMTSDDIKSFSNQLSCIKNVENETVKTFQRQIQGAPKPGVSKSTGVDMCVDSLFITPSFQSVNEKADGNLKANFSVHADRISNADFLNILGISQGVKNKESDSDVCSSSLHQIQQSNENYETPILSNTPRVTVLKDKTTNNATPGITVLDDITTNNARLGVTVLGDIVTSNSDTQLSNSTPMQNVAPGTDLEWDTGSISTIEYTELDVIPYSQFELTEDFLSESPFSQTTRNTRQGKRKVTGPLIKRKSPRLSSCLFSCKSSQGQCSDSEDIKSGLSLSKQTKQSLIAQKKAIAVMSIFQLLIDDAKKKTSPENFQLPYDFSQLIEAKIDLSTYNIYKGSEVELGGKEISSLSKSNGELKTKDNSRTINLFQNTRSSLGCEGISDERVTCGIQQMEDDTQDDNSVVQSSYHTTPVKIDGRLDKNKRTYKGQSSPLQISLVNNQKEKYSIQTNDKSFEEATTEITESKFKKLSILSEPDWIGEEPLSPVIKHLSHGFPSLVACSSTPILGRHTNTQVLALPQAPSPMTPPLECQSLTDKTVHASRRLLLLSPKCDHSCSTLKQTNHLSLVEKSLDSASFHEENGAQCVNDDGDTTTESQNIIGENENSLPLPDANCSSKTEPRYTDLSTSTHKEMDATFSAMTPTSKCHSVHEKSDRQIFLETSVGKSPFSKYLEESVVVTEPQHALDFQSPVHVSPWQKIPKTSSTPLQIFEKSCTPSGLLLSPVFTPSRMSRSRCKTKNSDKRNNLSHQTKNKSLKFEGCFQSCSEDAVVQLLHGKLFCDVNGSKRYLVSIQASALTVWIQEDGDVIAWSPELDWRLSSEIHVLQACIVPMSDKITIAASGWEKNQPLVTVFVYDFSNNNTFRFNIPDLEQCHLRISEIRLCICPSKLLLLGITSDTHHTLRMVTFQNSMGNIASNEAFDDTLQGKLNSLMLCREQENACISLTWDQRITIWNIDYRVAVKTITIPSHFPCLTSLTAVKAIKGLLLLTASWRVEEVDDCGGVIVLNPVTGQVYKTAVCNIPNAGWRSSEKTREEKHHVFAVSRSGSVSWWNSRNGNIIGYRQSNIATCVTALENQHVVIGEMHGCVHLYSLY